MEISAVIPAFNEEDRIASTIAGLQRIPNLTEIIVVDDGSTDKTSDMALRQGAHVIRLEKNSGKAFALYEGCQVAVGEIILFVDGDLGLSSYELRHLVTAIQNGDADITIAQFPKAQKKGGFGFVKFIASWGVERVTGAKLSSVLSGQRAIRRDRFLNNFLQYKGFGVETGMTIDFILSGCRYKEIPLLLSHRETGRDLKGIMHRIRQFLDILKVVYHKGAFKW